MEPKYYEEVIGAPNHCVRIWRLMPGMESGWSWSYFTNCSIPELSDHFLRGLPPTKQSFWCDTSINWHHHHSTFFCEKGDLLSHETFLWNRWSLHFLNGLVTINPVVATSSAFNWRDCGRKWNGLWCDLAKLGKLYRILTSPMWNDVTSFWAAYPVVNDQHWG